MGDTWHIIMERDALSSMLKDVQKECIELRQENELLRNWLINIKGDVLHIADNCDRLADEIEKLLIGKLENEQ